VKNSTDSCVVPSKDETVATRPRFDHRLFLTQAIRLERDSDCATDLAIGSANYAVLNSNVTIKSIDNKSKDYYEILYLR